MLGTRGSRLALWQARRVQALLEGAGRDITLQEITTRGDRVQDVPVSQLGDEAVFTKELDVALLAGEIDLAVHSLKDLPSRLPSGVALAAVSERATPFDAFVAHPDYGGTLADLPEGAVLATASLRRRAQLKAWRPDLEIVPVRGNVDTRIEKLDTSDWHGLILAVAGLERMGLAARIREEISPAVMVPAVGQGALGIVCREDDAALRAQLRRAVHHESSGVIARAERAFMKRLGGGCQVPTGAWARMAGAQLAIDGCVAALDGGRLLRERMTCAPDAVESTGRALAEALLERGGREILAAIQRVAP